MTLDLDAIEARANAAKPGPWTADYGNVSTCYRSDEPDFMVVVADDHGPTACANAEFIATARQDIPALIAEVRRLREVELSVIQYKHVRAERTELEAERDQLRATVEMVKALSGVWRNRDHNLSYDAYERGVVSGSFICANNLEAALRGASE